MRAAVSIPRFNSDRVFFCVSYVVFALPLILFYALVIPPFQVPDESSHLARAYQMSHGELFPTRQEHPDGRGGYMVGGTTDPGIYEAAGRLLYLQFDPAKKLTSEKFAEVSAYRWQQGEMRDTGSVAVNAPTFYAAPALGVAIGRYLDWSIIETLSLTRVVNGMFALCLSGVALLLLRRGFGVAFFLLLMPMTLAQMGSSSQDATCIAVAALCVALLSRIKPGMPQRERRVCLILSAVCLVALTAARPPYAVLSLIYPYFAYTFRTDRILATECCVALAATWLAAVLWALYVSLFVSVPFGLPGFDYGGQALFMLQNPLEMLGIFIETWRQRWSFYASSFIGVVGHLDTWFPQRYYHLAGLTLCFAFVMAYWPERSAVLVRLREQALVPVVIIGGSIVSIFLLLYVSWSPLKNPIIEGPQGRYFIPAALFLALAVPDRRLTGASQFVYRGVLLLFAAFTLVITPGVVISRYYQGGMF